MLLSIKSYIVKYNLIPPGSKIILGLSGGPDSFFLLHMLAKIRAEGIINKLIAAHLDHEWRDDSSKDAQFCLAAAKRYNVPIVTQKISDLGISMKFNGSKEEFGRKARRHFLESVRKKHNADLIALAHHAQDQQETFFIRLIRGTSLAGLTAMKPKHGYYIRPLLEVNKKNIVDYLEQKNIPYLTDPSNILEEFLRNRIRKKVITALQACDQRFDKKFKETLKRLSATEQFLEQLTEKMFNEISQNKEGILFVNLKQLFKLHPVMQYRILLRWLVKQKVKFSVSEGFFDEMIKFLKQPGSKEHQLYHAWYLVKKKDVAHIKLIST